MFNTTFFTTFASIFLHCCFCIFVKNVLKMLMKTLYKNPLKILFFTIFTFSLISSFSQNVFPKRLILYQSYWNTIINPMHCLEFLFQLSVKISKNDGIIYLKTYKRHCILAQQKPKRRLNCVSSFAHLL